tara:strand:+ start:1895 stop:2881 length:987 start_codon:yes stop_codon:yes gene_type:complete
MGILSTEQAAAIRQRIEGTPAPQAAPSAPSPAPAPAAAQPVSSEASSDVKEKQSATSEGESAKSSSEATDKASGTKTSTGQKVPYGRFRNVLDARNKYKSQVDRYKAEMANRTKEVEQLRQQLNSVSAQRTPAPAPVVEPQQKASETRESSWLDDILNTAEPASDAPQETDHLRKMQELLSAQEKQFSDRMHRYEVNQAQRELENEISAVRTRYPELQAKDLAQLVVNDPSVNLMEAAETFMTYKASLEEQAVARYLRANPHLTQAQKEAVVEAVKDAAPEAPVAPPRPVGSRSMPAGSETTKSESRNLKDVKYALREHFKQSNPFGR